jgi:hypothetical protein
VNRDLIQVGRDYIRYIHFQIDSGNIGGALLNIAVIVILLSGLAGGAYTAYETVVGPQGEKGEKGDKGDPGETVIYQTHHYHVLLNPSVPLKTIAPSEEPGVSVVAPSSTREWPERPVIAPSPPEDPESPVNYPPETEVPMDEPRAFPDEPRPLTWWEELLQAMDLME